MKKKVSKRNTLVKESSGQWDDKALMSDMVGDIVKLGYAEKAVTEAYKQYMGNAISNAEDYFAEMDAEAAADHLIECDWLESLDENTSVNEASGEIEDFTEAEVETFLEKVKAQYLTGRGLDGEDNINHTGLEIFEFDHEQGPFDWLYYYWEKADDVHGLMKLDIREVARIAGKSDDGGNPESVDGVPSGYEFAIYAIPKGTKLPTPSQTENFVIREDTQKRFQKLAGILKG
jgi:hypothetical protein